MTAKKDKVDFKKSIDELEEINEWFSSEDIDLEEGLEKLKKGKELILACQKRLNDVETEFVNIKEELENGGDAGAETDSLEDLDDLDDFEDSDEIAFDFE